MAHLSRSHSARPAVGGERRTKQTTRRASPPSAAASGPGQRSTARGVESKLPVQLRPATSGPGPKLAASGVQSTLPVHLLDSGASHCFLSRELARNSQFRDGVPRRRGTRQQWGRRMARYARRAVLRRCSCCSPSAAASEPGPKSAGRGVQNKLPVQQCPKTSGPGPMSATRSVESKLPVQHSPPPQPPPGQARSRRREAYKLASKLPVQHCPPPPLPQGQALSRQREA